MVEEKKSSRVGSLPARGPTPLPLLENGMWHSAISLIDEPETTPEMMQRIATGEGLTTEDQIWVLMQAVAKFTDILDTIPDECKENVNSQLVVDAVSMVLLAARADEREALGAYVTGDTNVIEELDGPSEAEPDKEV